MSRFIAFDVKRDIQIISNARLDEGILTCRIRTTNMLYFTRGLIDRPEFEPPKEIRIEHLWHWTGQMWGGLADGTSIVDHIDKPSSS